MSNQVVLQYTRFSNLDENGIVEQETIGYRIYDSHDHDYNNTFSSFKQLTDEVNLQTIMKYLQENHFEFYLQVKEGGISFNGVDYLPEDL